MTTDLIIVPQPEPETLDAQDVQHLRAELERLIFELECDEERCTTHLQRLKNDSAPLVVKYENLLFRLDEIYQSISEDDLEAESYRDEISEVLTDHGFTKGGMQVSEEDLDEEAAAEAANLMQRAKRVYKQICLLTHPDRHGDKYLSIFLRARTAFDDCDFARLDTLLAEVKGQYQPSTVQAYHEAILDANNALFDYHKTDHWHLYVTYLNHGYNASLTQFRDNLLETIQILEHKINRQSEI